jgi:FixJ family two-component response regulator
MRVPAAPREPQYFDDRPPPCPDRAAGLVYIVDDDDSIRSALAQLCQMQGYGVRACATGEEFLAGFDGAGPACIVLDLRMPRVSGPAVLEELQRRGCRAAVIILTGHGDVPAAVQAMRAGALDFLEKPVAPADLLLVVREALRLDAARLDEERRAARLRECLERLSARERYIMDRLLLGQTCKQIATELGLSGKAVHVYQRRVLHKMGTDTVAELVRQVVAQPRATTMARAAGHRPGPFHS